MKNLIIFDFDGTLIHSAPIVKNIINVLRARLNLSPLRESDIYPWISRGGLTMIASCLDLSEKKSTPWLKEFRRIYLKTKMSENLLYSGVVDFLNWAQKHQYIMAICSNKPEPLINKALEQTKIKSFFSVVLGGSEKTRAKPSPERILKILENLKLNKDESILVGDSLTDYETSYNAGIQFVFYENGYDDGVPIKNVNYSFNQFSDLASIVEAA